MARVNCKPGMVAYACDVGSTKQGNFGWAKASCDKGVIEIVGGSSITKVVELLKGDFAADRAVAIGMECPLFIPVPNDSTQLSRGREGDSKWSTFAPAGGYVAILGVHQLAFILKKVWRKGLSPVFDATKWNRKPKRRTVLFWEAFVSGKAKARGERNANIGDAATAASAFVDRVRTGQLTSDVSVEPPSEVLSLVGCVILWAGWSDDLRWLLQPVLVVKPDRPYQGEVRLL